MKTLRDILLARHQAAMSKLDAIRREAVAGLNHQDIKAQSGTANFASWCLGGLNKIWEELILPCRRIWTGLAAVWILIWAVNFSQRDGSQMVIAKSTPTVEMMTTFRDQQKLLNELLADRSPPMDAERPRIFSPKPRTEATELLTA